MTFDLTESQLKHFYPLPGHAIVRTLPPETTTSSGLLHLPENAAAEHHERAPVRKGRIVKVRLSNDTNEDDYEEADLFLAPTGTIVYYLGKADEADNKFVVVKIQQIVAMED